jgi:hypothetical protein
VAWPLVASKNSRIVAAEAPEVHYSDTVGIAAIFAPNSVISKNTTKNDTNEGVEVR